MTSDARCIFISRRSPPAREPWFTRPGRRLIVDRSGASVGDWSSLSSGFGTHLRSSLIAHAHSSAISQNSWIGGEEADPVLQPATHGRFMRYRCLDHSKRRLPSGVLTLRHIHPSAGAISDRRSLGASCGSDWWSPVPYALTRQLAPIKGMPLSLQLCGQL